jgi:hypothetical protein
MEYIKKKSTYSWMPTIIIHTTLTSPTIRTCLEQIINHLRLFISKKATMHLPSLIVAVLAIFLHSTTAYPGVVEVLCEVADIIIPGLECKDPVKPPEDTRSPTETYGNHEGSVSHYPDGTGKFVRTDDKYDWPNGYSCWTDLYYVESVQNDTWYGSKGEIDCGNKTASCELGINNGVQTCNKWSLGVLASAEVGITKDFFKISGSVTVTDEWSKCEDLTTLHKCVWTDKQCHAIWYGMSGRIDYGYIRRRCNFQGGETATVWSQDWDITEKGEDLKIGCDASCDAQTYPNP